MNLNWWTTFLARYGIAYVDDGPNVKRGNINISCLFCGDDPSEHLGIDPNTGWWSCWRNHAHSSKNPAGLIAAIAGCTFGEAKALIEEDQPLASTTETLEQQVGNLFDPPTIKSELRRVNPDPAFCLPTARFKDYLRSRGFLNEDLDSLICQYSLRCATCGQFRNRLIIPFLYKNVWAGWTGRSIINSAYRYLSYPSNKAVKEVVFNYDHAAKGGEALVVVEGPVDCLKIDFYGRKFGVRAVATLGTSVTAAQKALIVGLAANYRGVYVLFDPEAEDVALTLAADLGVVNAKPLFLSELQEDPGALRPHEVEDLCGKII